MVKSTVPTVPLPTVLYSINLEAAQSQDRDPINQSLTHFYFTRISGESPADHGLIYLPTPFNQQKTYKAVFTGPYTIVVQISDCECIKCLVNV